MISLINYDSSEVAVSTQIKSILGQFHLLIIIPVTLRRLRPLEMIQIFWWSIMVNTHVFNGGMPILQCWTPCFLNSEIPMYTLW